MKLRIEQIAICPPNPKAAMELLEALGLTEWAKDHVVANGTVFSTATTNEANLAFNYEVLERAREFEVLAYTKGENWMTKRERAPSVSHLGCHCTAEELEAWRAFFTSRGIGVAQEVQTQSHTNPIIAGKRRYTYVIFDTRPILGVDLKFIVRHMIAVEQ